MSDENVPKLRLKPKLAAEPVIVTPPPAIAPAAPVAPPPPATTGNEPKAVRLKPKLAAPPAQESAPMPQLNPAETGALPPWGASGAFSQPTPATNSSAEPLPPAEKSAAKFMLRPKAPTETPPTGAPAFPPPPPPTEIPAPAVASQDSIPAPPLFLDAELGGETPAGTIPQPLTARPFPPPPGNFPPPSGAANRPAPPWNRPKVAAKGSGKKFVKLGGGVLVVIAILSGGFFACKKFIGRRLVAEPVAAPSAPEASTSVTEQPKTVTAPVEPVPKAVAPLVEKAPPKPVEVNEPPPPSAAFKAWVDALRVGGVRAGANTRVFIGGTAYAPGEMVNPQLGITFEGYNFETRHLIFKDKTGATIQRRN